MPAVSLARVLSKGAAPISGMSSVDHLRAHDLKLDDEDEKRIDAISRRHQCEDSAWMSW